MESDMTNAFQGKSIIVTGAASGIGRATALQFAQKGGRVIAVDRDGDRLATLEHETKGNIQLAHGDITEPQFAASVVADAGGRIDVLANVAGIMDFFLPSAEVDDETWDRVIAINLTAPQRFMKAVLPGMIAAGGGAIVNVASEAGLRGGCAGAAYTASKHGLIGLTKNTAFIYAKSGIRANIVAPGPVDTGLQPNFQSALAAERITPFLAATIGAIGQPSDLASAILWIASTESRFVNGAVLAVDGGWSAI